MQNKCVSGFYSPRVFLAFVLCSAAALLTFIALGSEQARTDSNKPETKTAASARASDPMAGVRRVLAGYGILPGGAAGRAG